MPSVAGPGRAPRHASWMRRIVGVAATAALLGVAVAILVMILPSSDATTPQTAAVAPSVTPAPKTKKAPAKKGLTPAQKKARKAAVAAMSTQGWVPVRLSDYDPRHELRVLIGHQNGVTGGPRRAFFFAGGNYVGTDSTAPSTGLKVSGSGDKWVTLAYGVYSTGDKPCCPSGGRTKVRYEWSGTAVTPVGGTIPGSYQRVVTTG